MHDAGGDLIALCDTGGAGGSARIAGEWTYDAYGNVVTAAAHHAFAEPRLGHKGLFIERIDRGIIDPATGYEMPRLEPGATTLAFARNRHLHTGFGRWLQEDPILWLLLERENCLDLVTVASEMVMCWEAFRP